MPALQQLLAPHGLAAVWTFEVGSASGPALLALTVLLLVLLIPYIRHYYILENEVQKMYGQYDKIWERIHTEE